MTDFWSKNGANLAPKWDRKSMLTWKADFSKIVLSLQRGLDFSDLGGRSWDEKATKKLSKNGNQDGRHLGIDSRSILVDFWCQVGAENRPKIGPRRSQTLPDPQKLPEAARSLKIEIKMILQAPRRSPGGCDVFRTANNPPARAAGEG